MRRYVVLILYFFLLVSCRPATVIPPTIIEPEPPTPKAPLVELVRAVAVVGGKEYVLHQNGPAVTRLPLVDGEAVFEYSGPVDVDPSPGLIAVSGNIVRTHLIGSDRVVRTPSNVRDKQGRPLTSYEFYLERISSSPVRAYWVSGHLAEELEVPDGPWTLIMPGEAIRLNFSEEPCPVLMAEQLAATLGPGITYNLTWPDKKTLLLELCATQNTEFLLRLNETTYFGFYVTTPKKLAVLDRDRRVLSTINVPISTTSAIAMTSDLRHARLTRRVNLGWLNVGVQEYLLELGTGTIQPGKLHSRGTWYADEILLDWIDKTHTSSKTENYSPAGLSNNGDQLALYEDGKMKLVDLSINKTRTIAVQSRPESGFDFPHPYRVYWSHHDKHLYYTAVSGHDQAYWLYRLDLSTDTESAILKGHYLRSLSPHSHHLFTEVWEDLGQVCYILDGAGKVTRLSEPGEYVEVAKWLDAKRVLINKSSSPGQKCYVYHLDDRRWEYICDGYGFDYDLSTDRVFVLQNR